jgi:hypothetical protein
VLAHGRRNYHGQRNPREALMDSPLAIAVFGFGAVLLLIAVLNGSFKIYGAEISGSAGVVGRIVAGILGLVLIAFGLDKGGFLEPTASEQQQQLAADPPGAGGADETASAADEQSQADATGEATTEATTDDVTEASDGTADDSVDAASAAE